MAQLWTEKYRPALLADLHGQEDVKLALQGFVESRELPHLLFQGPPGAGKTSCVKLLQRMLYGDASASNVLTLNASDDRSLRTIRETVAGFARLGTTLAGSRGVKLVVLDEADSLTHDAQACLRRTMELFADTTRFVLLCNYVERLLPSIRSRCAVFRFAPLPEADVAVRLREVAAGEGVPLEPGAVEALCRVCRGDLRKGIGILQGLAGAADGPVSEDHVWAACALPPPAALERLSAAASRPLSERAAALWQVHDAHGVGGAGLVQALAAGVSDPGLLSRLAAVEHRAVHGCDAKAVVAELALLLPALAATARSRDP